jgi:hypothetical protein
LAPTSPGRSRTAAARAEHVRRAAERAVDDPRQLARAARIVRAALARKALEPTDLLEEVGPDAA